LINVFGTPEESALFINAASVANMSRKKKSPGILKAEPKIMKVFMDRWTECIEKQGDYLEQ